MSEEEPEKHDVRMIAAKELTIDGEGVAIGARFGVSAGIAVDLFLERSATLFPAQDRPPMRFLKAVAAQVEVLKRFGPLCVAESVFSAMEQKLFTAGSPNSVVNGRALNWIQGGPGLLEAVRAERQRSFLGFEGHLDQLRSCWNARQSTTSIFTTKAPLDKDAQIEKGWVPKPVSRGELRALRQRGENSYHWLAVGTPWASYKSELDEMEAQTDTLLLRAFQEGRVLRVTFDHGWCVVPPWDWKQIRRLPKVRPNDRFLFSRDIPAQWFPKGKQLRGKDREAAVEICKRAIEKRYLLTAPNHKAFKKEDIITEVVEETAYDTSIVRSGWSEAEIPNWSKLGRRKA